MSPIQLLGVDQRWLTFGPPPSGRPSQTNSRSSLTIVPTPTPSAIVALDAFLSSTWNVSLGSNVVSPLTPTEIWRVTFTGNRVDVNVRTPVAGS
jgi:hypothetical protein